MFKKLSPKSDSNHEYTATVRFLDDSDPLHIKFQKQHTGQWLLDKVCSELNLVEQDYFGLRYVDGERQRHWIDPLKAVFKQLKNVSPMVVCFRVKFYPDDPLKLQEEVTRYSLFLQLRRDLHHGRLLCSTTDANNLAAHIIQSEVGDYHEEDCKPGYVSKFKMLPRQTLTDEEKITEIHKTLGGLVPSDAEEHFLKKACTLDTYGVDPHQVQDSKGVSMYLGVTHLGVVTFHSNKRNALYKWEQINKLAFDSNKQFIINLEEEGKKVQIGYRCPTYAACKHLWKCAVEQQAFFTLDRSSEAKKVVSGGGLFRRSSKYRFSGRCQSEVFSYSTSHKRETIDFTRSPSSTLQRRFSQKRPERPAISITDLKKELDADKDEDTSTSVSEVTQTNESNTEAPQVTEAAPSEEVVKATENVQVEAEPAAETNENAIVDTTDCVATVEDNQPEVIANHVKESVDLVGDGKVEELVSATTEIVEKSTPDGVQDVPGPSGDDAVTKTEEEECVEEKVYSRPPKPEKVPEAPPVLGILLFLLVLTVLVVVVMDDRIDIAFLRDVRRSAVLSNVRFQYYNPVRDFVRSKIQSLTGSSS